MSADERVSFSEAARVWAKIGCLSFGGPAGQIALMHRELVERRKWIDEERFLHALSYCTLLPGPEAQQLATYIGWLMHRTRGGLLAGLWFILPGTLTMLLLSVLYAELRELPPIAALFFGLKAAVLAVVIEAVLRVGRRALRNRVLVSVAAVAFVAIFFFEVPFPWVVLCAGVTGWLGSRLFPDVFRHTSGARITSEHASVIDRMERAGELAHTRPTTSRLLRVLVVWGALWAAPFLILAPWLGSGSVYFQQAGFFSQAALVTFGGAYAVLAYVAQQAVESYGWLRPGEMLDGLGLAETTPGPLILVVQFVAFLGAYRNPGLLPPLVAGVLGSLVTVWVTFVPCFLWIFVGAPYIEALRGNRALQAALSAITAAVVGVILNLSLWFGLHVVFRDVAEQRFGMLRLYVPDVASIDLAATALAALAMLAMFRWKLGMPVTLAGSAALGVGWKLLSA